MDSKIIFLSPELEYFSPDFAAHNFVKILRLK